MLHNNVDSKIYLLLPCFLYPLSYIVSDMQKDTLFTPTSLVPKFSVHHLVCTIQCARLSVHDLVCTIYGAQFSVNNLVWMILYAQISVHDLVCMIKCAEFSVHILAYTI